jgi:N-acyl homoserine lactone hydrolase
MKIHAIETGKVAVHERQREGSGPGPLRLVNTLLDRRWTDRLPIYSWAIEHPEGLIVVDTGETARVAESGYFPRWHPYFRFGVREWVEANEEAGPSLRRLGLDPSDVRWVVMTHLHTDHAGGLGHFPDSEILVSRVELKKASGRWESCVASCHTAGLSGSGLGKSTSLRVPPGRSQRASS